MISFRPVTADELHSAVQSLKCQSTRFCDFSTGIIFMWRKVYHTEFTVAECMLFYKAFIQGETAFSVPMGCSRMKTVFDHIEEYACAVGIPLCFWAMAEEGVALLRERYGSRMTCYADPAWSDYLYTADDMVSFAGRKYSGQRNHINRFKKEHPDFEFKELTDEYLEEAKAFFDRCALQMEHTSETALEEDAGARELLDYIKPLKLKAACILVDGKIAALSVGEVMNDTLYIHVERADRDYQGIHQVLVNEFAKQYVTQSVLFINREEDDGQEGLRRSKESYHPIRLLQKYFVKIAPETE